MKRCAASNFCWKNKMSWDSFRENKNESRKIFSGCAANGICPIPESAFLTQNAPFFWNVLIFRESLPRFWIFSLHYRWGADWMGRMWSSDNFRNLRSKNRHPDFWSSIWVRNKLDGSNVVLWQTPNFAFLTQSVLFCSSLRIFPESPPRFSPPGFFQLSQWWLLQGSTHLHCFSACASWPTVWVLNTVTTWLTLTNPCWPAGTLSIINLQPRICRPWCYRSRATGTKLDFPVAPTAHSKRHT